MQAAEIFPMHAFSIHAELSVWQKLSYNTHAQGRSYSLIRLHPKSRKTVIMSNFLPYLHSLWHNSMHPRGKCTSLQFAPASPLRSDLKTLFERERRKWSPYYPHYNIYYHYVHGRNFLSDYSWHTKVGKMEYQNKLFFIQKTNYFGRHKRKRKALPSVLDFCHYNIVDAYGKI